MKSVAEPRSRYALRLRSMMSAGESVGATVFAWCREALGITVTRCSPDRDELHRRQFAAQVACPPAAWASYPGHRVAVIDDGGNVLPPARSARSRSTGATSTATSTRSSSSATGATRRRREQVHRRLSRTGDLASADEDGYLWYQGRADDVFKAAGYGSARARSRNAS